MAGPVSATYGDKPFTNAATGGSGTIKYGSSNSAVAVVDAGGTITITGAYSSPPSQRRLVVD
jgi:hypothetical protein